MSDSSKAKKPLDPKAGNPSLNSEIHAAIANQSSVTPEDYPAAEREGQTAVVGAGSQQIGQHSGKTAPARHSGPARGA